MELEDYEKVPDSQVLRGPDLLKTLPPQTKLFDNLSLSGSETSELSGPFSDVVYNVESESKRKAKELYGKDLYTAFSFSSEFKAAMEHVKKQMILENPDYLKTESLVAEDLEKVKSGELRPLVVDNEAFIEKYKFLQTPVADFDEQKEEEEEVEDKKKDKEARDKKKKAAKIWQDDDEMIFDTMSGYWRLLSVFDEFRISSPWYDAYAEGKEHWLQTKPIPKETLEHSREKCLNWLKTSFEK